MRGRRLGRAADQRKALLRALTTEVLRHGQITTTLTKCKEVRKSVDKMIGLAKDGSLHARRQAIGYMYDKQLVHSLFEAVRAARGWSRGASGAGRECGRRGPLRGGACVRARRRRGRASERAGARAWA